MCIVNPDDAIWGFQVIHHAALDAQHAGQAAMLRDIPAACSEIFAGNLGLPAYLRQLREVSGFANFAWDDPLPALADAPAIILRKLRL